MNEHHYLECGLTNVVIHGIEAEIDDDGDEIVTIPAINELHRVIALGIVQHGAGISGDELRFLRTEMGLTQAELARLVHRDKQSVGRWERNEVELDNVSEAFIRRLAIERLRLPTELSIEELSRRSVPGSAIQQIDIEHIAANDDGAQYQLQAA